MDSRKPTFPRRRRPGATFSPRAAAVVIIISGALLAVAMALGVLSWNRRDGRRDEGRVLEEPEMLFVGDDWEEVRFEEEVVVAPDAPQKIELPIEDLEKLRDLERELDEVVVAPERTPEAVPDAPRPVAPAPTLGEGTGQELRELERSPVLISEIHYHPLENPEDPSGESGRSGAGSTEFVELFNRSEETRDLSRWELAGGIAFTVPDGTRLGAGEFLVVCGDPEAFAKRYGGLDARRVVGGFQGRLSNRGETIVLITPDGEVADRVRYEDRLPFDVRADGRGPSLERLCFETDSSAADNWRASREPGGSPLLANQDSDCPPGPRPPSSAVVINEIHYHPFDDLRERLEFVELHNRGETEVDLHGWSLRDAVRHSFDRQKGPTRIAPGGFLVVARFPEELRRHARLPEDAVAGPYGGKLSNYAERLVLADAEGLEVEAVPYRQDGAWPARADGLGSSLQRVSPDVAAHVPWNWKVYTSSPARPGAESTVFQNGARVRWYENLDGRDPGFSGEVPWFHPDFDDRNWAEGPMAVGYDVSRTVPGWLRTRGSQVEGVHSYYTRLEFTMPALGDRSLVPRLFMDFDDGVIVWLNGVEIARQGMRLPPGQLPPLDGNYHADQQSARGEGDREPGYRLVWTGALEDLRTGRNVLAIGNYNCNATSSDLFSTAKLTLKAGGPEQDITPGAKNAVLHARPAPLIELVSREPPEPGSRDSVVLRVRTEGPLAESVTLYVDSESGEERIAMRDDGRAPDQRAGDRIHAASIPPRPDLSIVRFRVAARTAGGGLASLPRGGNPARQLGYYVCDEAPQENEDLEVFHMIWTGSLRCTDGAWRRGGIFVHRGTAYLDVGVKRRGDTSCSRPKPGLRIAFNKGELFRGQSRLNLLGCWEDSSFLREKLAWDLYRDIGHPHCLAKLTRVQFAGNVFGGLFVALEDPDENYLRRNGLDADASLWKSRNSLQYGHASSMYRRSNREASGDSAELLAFAREVKELLDHGRLRNGQTVVDWVLEKIDVESFIEYQVVKCLISDEDSYSKNWLLYHGKGKGSDARLWAPQAWDLDLSFGQIHLGDESRYFHKHPLMGTRSHTREGSSWNGPIEVVFGSATDDYFIKALYGRLWDVLEEKFHPDILLEKVDRLEANTAEEAAQDLRQAPRFSRYSRDGEFYREQIREYIRRRFDHLRSYITRENPSTLETASDRSSSRVTLGPNGRVRFVSQSERYRRFRYTPAPRLKITEIHFADAIGDRGEFIEIRNLENREIDLAGWNIPAVGYVFAQGAAVAPGAFLVVCKDPGSFRELHGEIEGLAVLGPYEGSLSDAGEALRLRDSGDHDGKKYFPETIDVVKYESVAPWPEVHRAGAGGIELRDLNLDNDYGRHWRASRRHGDPGRIGVR